jgi:hypothetical protein
VVHQLRSKGRIFSDWASVNKQPYRAIGPPSALLTLFISHFRQFNYLRIQAFASSFETPSSHFEFPRVVVCFLVRFTGVQIASPAIRRLAFQQQALLNPGRM